MVDGVEQSNTPGGGVVDDGERRVLPALRRLLAVGQDQVPAGQRSTDETVRDDGEVSLGRGGRLLHEHPGAIDASVEDLPAFTVGRRIARREHVEAELRIRRAANIAEIALLEKRMVANGRARDAPEVVGRGDGPREIAREDAGDA